MFSLLSTRRSQAQRGDARDSVAAPGVVRPLSIAMMIESVNLGGAEMVVLRLAEALRARGHRVCGVVPAGRTGWLVDEFQAGGFEWFGYDLRRPIDRGFPARLARMFQEMGAELVHSHEFVMAVYGAAAARRLRLPHVITMHGNQTTTQKFQRRVALRGAFRHSPSAPGSGASCVKLSGSFPRTS
jgi:hypothetical protein